MTRLLTLSLLSFAACSSAEPREEPAPDVEAHARDMREQDEKRRDFYAVLIRLDQAMDSYAQALGSQGEYRADLQAERLEKLIRETVLDSGPSLMGAGAAPITPGSTFLRLQAAAADGTNTRHQGIALAALGFSGLPQAMPTILQGLLLTDTALVDKAAFGLAILRNPGTPLGPLAAIAQDVNHPEDGRANAAWAMYRIQTAATDVQPFVDIWLRFLTEQKDRMPVSVQVSAVRGLGLARDPTHGELVATFLKHPTPRMRMTAAIALGRMRAQAQWRELLALLEPAETVQNVRLSARKALAELAGGNDYGYDVSSWRNAFDRGSR